MSQFESQVEQGFEEAYRKAGFWRDEPLTQILFEQAEANAHKVAIIEGDRQITYLALEQMANNLALYLQQQGVKRFDTALVQLPNCAEFYVVYFALLKLGVASVNAHFHYQESELSHCLEQLKPNVLIVSQTHELFSNDAFVQGINPSQYDFKAVLSLGDCEYANSLASILSETKQGQPKTIDQASDADQLAFYQLSAGSNTRPKLIARTHNDYLYSVQKSVESCGLNNETRYLCALPLHHNFSMSAPGAIGVFYVGACLVIANSPDPVECFDLVRKHQVNMTALTPVWLNLWLEYATKSQDSLPSLKLLQLGCAGLTPGQAKRVHDLLACQLQQVIVMEEGLASKKVILDTGNSQEALNNKVVRGPYVFQGFFNGPSFHQVQLDETEINGVEQYQSMARRQIDVLRRDNQNKKRLPLRVLTLTEKTGFLARKFALPLGSRLSPVISNSPFSKG